jgi:hypothetical protein
MMRLLICGIAATACGPSFQAIYEGDARFEHCYALEENPNLSMAQKGECWRDWMAHYTYGQTRDRVAYAAARAQAINKAPELPTDEAMMHAAPGEIGPRSGVVAPAPTSAFAPPPKTLGEASDAGTSTDWAKKLPPPEPPPSDAKDAGVAPRPPMAECLDDCQRSWTACRAPCTDGKKSAACDKCPTSYKTCIKTCTK